MLQGLTVMSTLLADAASRYSQTAADRMSEFEQHLEDRLAQVTAAQKSLGNAWDGSGGQAQAAAAQRWSEGAQEMRQALADLRRIAVAAHENYRGAIQTNSLNWG
ncbi:WXG100 family type VII secretion target [Mycobacterium shimoidei]|nr:WXG100 family type VII secretion target [Mycobacterium shimoidei]